MLYNRAVVTQVFIHQGILKAQKKYGVKAISGEQLRWGMENIDMTATAAASFGMKGMGPNLKISCEDHIGGGGVFIQQWDGKKWNIVSEFIKPMNELVVPAMEASAAKYLKEKKVSAAILQLTFTSNL